MSATIEAHAAIHSLGRLPLPQLSLPLWLHRWPDVVAPAVSRLDLKAGLESKCL